MPNKAGAVLFSTPSVERGVKEAQSGKLKGKLKQEEFLRRLGGNLGFL